MDISLEWAIEFIKKEWTVITGAPLSMITIIGLIAYISYKYFKNHFQLVIDTQKTTITVYKERIEQLETNNNNKAIGNTQEQILTFNSSIKERTKQLSADILKFVKKRKNESLSNPNIKKTAIHAYEEVYSYRVIAVYEELRDLDYSDAKLDRFYQKPKNLEEIQLIGARLGAIAEKMS